MPSSRSRCAVPSIVWTTNWVETSRERPSRIPASIIASASSAKYAGPEPDTAVTAPRWLSASSATRRCRSSAWAPAQIPAIPSCTVAGRFGIARTTGTPSATWRSIAAVGIAAATESTVCSGVSTPPISPRRASKSCGLTAITTSAEPATADALSSVTSIPCRSASSCARSSSRTVATISPGSRQPPVRSPRSSDSPIVPAPRMATRRSSMARSLGGGRLRELDQAKHVGIQHVDAREPGPLAVGLEELGGLPRLDPAALQRRLELDEPEIGDEPAVVAPEPFEGDHADRPWAQPALAQQPLWRSVSGKRAQPLEVERPADADERRAAAHAQAEPAQLGGRDGPQRRAIGWRMEPRAFERRHQRPHDPLLGL